jgi:hypothetical protein
MSTAPNWAGIPAADNPENVVAGDLYILPTPPTIDENPRLGLADRNVVDLPTKYKDLDVKNLTFETINPPYPVGAEKWSKYPAIDDVSATRTEAPFNLRQWDITGFKDVDGSSFHAVREGLPVPSGGTITADFGMTSPIGSFGLLSASTACQVDGSMVVNGPTTLDGGTIHGTSIGSLPIEGINSVRIDVLPIGIDIVSPTYITIDAAGAGNFACGGALSLAGGSYIEYNSDQHYFINSSAGNDYTDILVGNIHPAFEGTDNLRINGGGSGRGVYLDDGVMVRSKIHNTPQFSYFKVSWSADTFYSEFEEVDYEGVCYISQIANKNFPPGSSYQPWDIDTSYVVGNLVFVLLNTFRCISDITGGDGPGTDTDHWEAVGLITDPVWLANGEKFADNQVSFKKEPADGYEWSFIKLKNSEGLRVMRKLIDVNTQVIGRLYDDTLYPPTIGTLPVSGDLNMNLFSVLNAQKIQPSQLDVGIDWLDNAVYTSGDYVVSGSSVYLCIAQNLNLLPSGTIPEWSNDSVEYTIDNIVQYDGRSYGCILGYTSTGEDNAPDGDTDHWAEQFIGTGIANYWEFVRASLNGGVEFPAVSGDMKYFTLTKPTGSAYTSLWITERTAGTGELSNAGQIYDTGINPPKIGGEDSLVVYGDLDMSAYSINNLINLTATDTLGLSGGIGGVRLDSDLNANAKNITGVGILTTDIVSSATGSSVVLNSNLDMALNNITNVNDLAITQLMSVSGGPGYVFVRDQLEGDGKSIQNFNLLGLIGPATGDDATLQLKTTADSVGLEAKVNADTGEASITANMGVPLTITTNGELILNGNAGISANVLNMSGDISLGGNDITSCDNINTNSINSIGNIFRRGNFASIVDQTFTAGSTAEQQIQMTETLGTTNGVSLNAGTYEIAVDADGSYKVDMTYQLNSSGGSHTHSYFWVKNNGTAIPVSTQQKTARNNEVLCVSYSRIFQLASGDKLTFWWNSSNANDYLYNDAGLSTPYVRPRQPSVAISVVSC